ncbi:MAG TPA: nuclear transport factor 2 family protein [Steroidobacteraceae bacterium]|nr:nuclear transport factor 2 family protein [Steroidobacteraceae bacterium]
MKTMTSHLFACCLALALAIPAAAEDSVHSAIEAVEQRFARALEARDRPALEPLLTDQFTWIHASDGRVDTREVWLATAARGTALAGQRTERTEHGATIQLHGAPQPNSAIRIARVRLLDAANKRESWLRQTHVLVRGGDGHWRLALGQGVLMYEGPVLDMALHQRYVGTYAISPDRKLVLAWDEGSLQATFPTGAKTQIFLASPTEEASRTLGAGRLKFTLGEDGRPVAASLVRGSEEVWRARREQ